MDGLHLTLDIQLIPPYGWGWALTSDGHPLSSGELNAMRDNAFILWRAAMLLSGRGLLIPTIEKGR